MKAQVSPVEAANNSSERLNRSSSKTASNDALSEGLNRSSSKAEGLNRSSSVEALNRSSSKGASNEALNQSPSKANSTEDLKRSPSKNLSSEDLKRSSSKVGSVEGLDRSASKIDASKEEVHKSFAEIAAEPAAARRSSLNAAAPEFIPSSTSVDTAASRKSLNPSVRASQSAEAMATGTSEPVENAEKKAEESTEQQEATQTEQQQEATAAEQAQVPVEGEDENKVIPQRAARCRCIIS